MARSLALLAFVISLAGSSAAASSIAYRAEARYQVCGAVKCSTRCETWLGSAVVIATRPRSVLVLTNRHLVEPVPGSFAVDAFGRRSDPAAGFLGATPSVWIDGAYRVGKVLAISQVEDVALLEIPAENTATINATPLAVATPQPGAAVEVRSFVGGLKFRARPGVLLNASRVSLAFSQGESGSPVIDAEGRLVGLVWGADGSIVAHRHLVDLVGDLAAPETAPAAETAPVEVTAQKPDAAPATAPALAPALEGAGAAGAGGNDPAGDVLGGLVGKLPLVLGLGGVPGVLAGIGINVLWRRWRRRRGQADPVRTPAAIGDQFLGSMPADAVAPRPPVAPPVVVSHDAAPEVRIVTQNQVVPIVSQTLLDAIAWAEREALRKYPGTASTVEYLRSLINQYLASKGETVLGS